MIQDWGVCNCTNDDIMHAHRACGVNIRCTVLTALNIHLQGHRSCARQSVIHLITGYTSYCDANQPNTKRYCKTGNAMSDFTLSAI